MEPARDEPSPPGASGANAGPREGASFVIGAAVALAAGALSFTSLPPVHNDEYLPLLPLTFFSKGEAARSALLATYEQTALGVRFPALAYPYVGSLKGLLWAGLSLPTGVTAYRSSNLALLAVVFGLAAITSVRIGGRSALALGLPLALLAGDTGLIVLAITDEGPILLGLILALLLLRLLLAALERRSVRAALLLAAVVFLGTWDRLNFLWFAGAALAAATAAVPAVEPPRLRRVGLAAAGVLLGMVAALAGVKGYVGHVQRGWDNRIPWHDLAGLGAHARELLRLSSAPGAFHRYVEVEAAQAEPGALAYQALTGLLVLAAAGLPLALGALRVRRGALAAARPLLVQGAFVLAALVAMVQTRDAWAAHHAVVVKPFVYVSLGALAAAAQRRPALALSVALAVGSAAGGARGLAQLVRLPLIEGIYGVSWNAVDAWRAAARSSADVVLALDWGVFYPGVVNSPGRQRWEAAEDADRDSIWSGAFGSDEAVRGFLYRPSGPRRDLIEGLLEESPFHTILERRDFRSHPGESWALLVAKMHGLADLPASAATDGRLENGDFARATAGWTIGSWQSRPGAAAVLFVPCDASGTRCVLLRHTAEARSCLEQPVALEPGTAHRVGVWARARDVRADRRGARLGLLGTAIGSAEIRGNGGWRQLELHVVSSRGGVARVGLCLGEDGSPTTGEAYFTRASVEPLKEVPRGVTLHSLP